MAEHKYLTSPVPSERMPSGIPFIVGNEAAERFSFYGMKAILFVFITKHLLGASGQLAPMTESEATAVVHTFVFAAYFFPILGAIISDAFLGKYRTILYLSIIYCLGHLALALDETRLGLYTGLTLIAIGTGAIKPCVSAHVGDQFGSKNKHLLSKVFGWFYFSINLGAFASTLLTPYLLKEYGDEYGASVAFGVPGVLMALATFVFWLGRNRFVHVPPGGMNSVREAFSGEGLRAMRNLIPIYVFVAMFWSLFDQTASKWVAQAEDMDRTWHIAGWFPQSMQAEQWLPAKLQTVEWLPSQVQAVNPILIMLFIPLFSYVIYPALNKIFPLTPLRKVSIGFFVTSASFAVSAWIETQIAADLEPDIAWQILAYAILTSAEIMVSITCLEFSYTQAPNRIKSFIMSLYLLSVAAGNLFTAGVNYFIAGEDGKPSKLEGADYYWFFTGTMFVAAVGFIFIAMNYRGRTYIQDEQNQEQAEAEEGEVASV